MEMLHPTTKYDGQISPEVENNNNNGRLRQNFQA